jgi:TolA-binding protein
MATGDTGQALAELGALARAEPAAARDEALLLRARALLNAGRTAEAARQYEQLRAQRPGTAAARKAAFGLAECRAREGRFAQAEELFAQGLQELVASPRQDLLPKLLQKLGREYLKPPGSSRAPDPARAARLFQEALDAAGEGPLRAELTVDLARALARQKVFAQAANQLLGLLATTPAPPTPTALRYRAARLLWKGKEMSRARQEIRHLLEDPAAGDYHARALLLLARTQGMPSPRTDQELVLGQEALRRFLALAPTHPRAGRARLELALAPLKLGRFALAEEDLRELLSRELPEESLEEARYGLGLALAGQGRWPEAAAAYTAYLQAHPAGGHWTEARQGIEECAWQEAEERLRASQPAAAAERFAGLAEAHPGSPRAPEALLRAARARVAAHEIDEALRLLTQLTAKYPTSLPAADGWLLTGELQEEERREPAKAREAYGRITQGPRLGEARARLAALDLPSLTVESPPTFRTDARPHLVWRTRNLESVTVSLYRLQAEDFFRDRTSLDEATAVDIALCTPDRTWQVPVQEYRKYQRIRQEVPLPIDRPGLYLVHLLADKLEATTAVRVSDLEVIVKNGPGGLFVFAEDLRRRQPWPDARIAVAQEGKILAQGETDREGILRTARPATNEEEEAPLRLLAVRGDHVAWVGLEPAAAAATVARERGLLLTDRPVYVPGDRAEVMGYLRDTNGAALRVPREGSWTLRLQGPGDLPRGQWPVASDRLGSFHRPVLLDPLSPPGEYRLTLQRTGGGDARAFSCGFTVERPDPAAWSLQLLLDRPTVAAGEPVQGVLRVRDPAGRPAPDQTLQYRHVRDTTWQTGRTDSQGLLAFTLPTAGIEQSGPLEILANFPGGKLAARGRVLVTAQALHGELGIPPQTLFAGESFPVTVRLTGADGAAVAGTVLVELVRREAATPPREVRLLRQELAVPPTGEVQLPVTVPRPGSHVLRLLGWDPARHPTTAELPLAVEDPRGRALHLDVAPTQLVGTPAQVRLRNPGERGLALLTWERDRVVGHRVVALPPGATTVSLPIDEELAPGALLAASLLVGDERWSAQREVAVSRQLALTVELQPPQPGPGDEVRLRVQARDEAGRPVEAGVRVAVVDELLLLQHPVSWEPLVEAFYGPLVPGEVLTVASNQSRFPAADGTAVAEARVRETEGSAAMAALRERRRVVTEPSAAGLADLGMGYGRGVGSLGLRGTGMGGGGSGHDQVRLGKAIRHGTIDRLGAAAQGKLGYRAATAAFFPALATGRDGWTSASFRLPATSQRWRVQAWAVTGDSRAGEAELSFTASRPCDLRLIVAEEAASGDRLRPVAQLTNETRQPLQATVTFDWPGRPATPGAPVSLPPLGSAEVVGPELEMPTATLGHPLELGLVASVRGGAHTSAATEAASPGPLDSTISTKVMIRQRPAGLAEAATLVRVLEGGEEVDLTLGLSPGVQPTGLEVRAGSDPAALVATWLDPLVAEGRPEPALLALHAEQLLGPEPGAEALAAVRQQQRESLLRLLATQRPDGGFGLATDPTGADLERTALAVRALARARLQTVTADWTLPEGAFQRATTRLEAALAALPAEESRRRALVLRALTEVGEGRAPSVQLLRLHRLRAELTPGVVAALGLTWLQQGRPELAAEAAETVRQRLTFPESPPAAEERAAASDGPTATTELDRLHALTLLARTRPDLPLVAEGRAWLLGRAHVDRWSLPRLAEAAAECLVALHGPGRAAREAELIVEVDGQEAGRLRLPAKAATGGEAGSHARPPEVTLTVDPARLAATGSRVRLRGSGDGRLFVAVRLQGHQPLAEPAEPAGPALVRHLELLPAPYRGQPLPAGFRILEPGAPEPFADVDRLPVGREGLVTLALTAPDAAAAAGPWWVEDQLPPGLQLLPGDGLASPRRTTGTHGLTVRQAGSRIAVLLPAFSGKALVQYRVLATSPATTRFTPARLAPVDSLHRALSGGGRPLRVVPADEPPPVRGPSPDELHAQGRAAVTEHEPALALQLLEKLLLEHPVQEGVAAKLLPVLLFAALDANDQGRIVKYFELAKEKDPSLVIPFDKIGPLQAAYRALGLHEAGLHLARGIADARFLGEVRSVGLLEEEEEPTEAIRLLDLLQDEYPDSQLVADAAYNFAGVLHLRADEAAQGDAPEGGLDRDRLIEEAAHLYGSFAARFPDHPQAPAAVFALGSALLELARNADAARWGEQGLRRHGRTELGPALTYLTALAHFKAGNQRRTMELCRRLVDSPDAQDESRQMAIYVLAQLHHARGEIDRARELYRQVADDFPDAAETVEELEREELRLPEVVEVEAGQFPTLPAVVRGDGPIEVRVYDIDLLKLYLLEGSLADLGEINLSGVKPALARVFPATQSQSTGPSSRPLLLNGLPGRGAFLALARLGGQTARSLVLVDHLRLEVNHPAADRVRVAVRDRAGRPVPDARVQLKGEDDDDFTAGKTDLRGLFIAPAAEGRLTVLATANGRYGLIVEPEEDRPPSSRASKPRPAASKAYQKKQSYDFEEDNVEGALIRSRQDQAGARGFFEKARQVQGMQVDQAR